MIKFLKKLNLFNKKNKSFYNLLGGENGISELVENFYSKMESDPKAKKCLDTHPLENGKVPQLVKQKLLMFLSGWLGGPNLFVENIGAPRMRMRHMHITITAQEAEQWLYCMEYALNHHKTIKLKKHTKERVLNSCMALTMRIINSE
ncbi:MAG: globin [Bacteriovoracaceae bacterium]|nr:globin [Bacteriovoracaceae bacterium]